MIIVVMVNQMIAHAQMTALVNVKELSDVGVLKIVTVIHQKCVAELTRNVLPVMVVVVMGAIQKTISAVKDIVAVTEYVEQVASQTIREILHIPAERTPIHADLLY